MSSLKESIKEYLDKFKDVPRTFKDRLSYIVENYKLSSKHLTKIEDSLNMLNEFDMYEEFSFVLYVIPKPSPRPRMVRGGTHCYVSGANDDKKLFTQYLDSLGDKRPSIIITPCEIFLDYYLETPKSMKKTDIMMAELKYIRPVAVPDVDNVAKKYIDMTQESLLLNDSLIVGAYIQKYYSILPRVEIRIRYQKGFMSEFNRKKVESWSSYKDLKKEDNN